MNTGTRVAINVIGGLCIGISALGTFVVQALPDDAVVEQSAPAYDPPSKLRDLAIPIKNLMRSHEDATLLQGIMAKVADDFDIDDSPIKNTNDVQKVATYAIHIGSGGKTLGPAGVGKSLNSFFEDALGLENKKLEGKSRDEAKEAVLTASWALGG